jgi:hypothetical protein
MADFVGQLNLSVLVHYLLLVAVQGAPDQSEVGQAEDPWEIASFSLFHD